MSTEKTKAEKAIEKIDRILGEDKTLKSMPTKLWGRLNDIITEAVKP